MPNWNGTLLTAKGRALQAKVEAGAVMTITKLKIGDGTLGSGQNVDVLTDLLAPKKTLGISALTPLESGVCKITAVVTNAGLTAGFYVRELGVFAQDPDLGEILYAYTSDGSPDYLPAEGGTVAVAEELVVQLAFSNAANITATISLDGLITTAILNTHKNAAVLDHPDGSVTDAKVGNRTITDTTMAAVAAGTLTAKLSQLGYMIKAVTGGAAWYTAPVATIVTLFGKFNATTGHKHTGGADDAPQIGTTGIADGAVTSAKLGAGAATDTVMGNRIITDILAAVGTADTLTNLLSKVGYMIKGITGQANWYTPPAITLGAANTHINTTASVHGSTNVNTASRIVQRDASGNFSAGTITGALAGNAATATKWITPRILTLNGDVTGSVSMDGSGDATLTTTNTAAMPVGFTFPLLANSPLPGSLALQGALVSRTTYPDLWAWVQANAPLVTEAAWQAQAAVQSSVGAYSSGDGSTTFRLPKIVDYVRGGIAADVGKWQGDAIRNITGSFNLQYPTDGILTGAFEADWNNMKRGSAITAFGAVSSLIFDASNTVPIADENRPKTVVMLWCVKAFGAAINQGIVDMGALAADVAGLSSNKLNKADYHIKAWVNFNGTGTVAIRSSYNVSSIGDNGVGDYTINFTTPMVDSNYGHHATYTNGTATPYAPESLRANVTVNSIRISQLGSANGPAGATDWSNCNVTIFR